VPSWSPLTRRWERRTRRCYQQTTNRLLNLQLQPFEESDKSSIGLGKGVEKRTTTKVAALPKKEPPDFLGGAALAVGPVVGPEEYDLNKDELKEGTATNANDYIT